MITVLMREAVRRMTVQQLYPYDVRTLSAFVCACSDGDRSVTDTPLTEA
jgi:hypothetical protein